MTHILRIVFLTLTLFLFTDTVSANDLDGIAGGGPSADRLAVLQTLEIYLTVTDNKLKSSIRESFHPTAHLMSVSREGALRTLTQDFWWERVSRIPDNAPPRESRVLIIDVSGHAAIARIDIKNRVSGEMATDYLNLQKVASGWRIVNKTLSKPL